MYTSELLVLDASGLADELLDPDRLAVVLIDEEVVPDSDCACSTTVGDIEPLCDVVADELLVADHDADKDSCVKDCVTWA